MCKRQNSCLPPFWSYLKPARVILTMSVCVPCLIMLQYQKSSLIPYSFYLSKSCHHCLQDYFSTSLVSRNNLGHHCTSPEPQQQFPSSVLFTLSLQPAQFFLNIHPIKFASPCGSPKALNKFTHIALHPHSTSFFRL